MVRDRFDLEALIYYEEKREEAIKKSLKEAKSNKDQGETRDFESFKDLLALARENAGEVEEDDENLP